MVKNLANIAQTLLKNSHIKSPIPVNNARISKCSSVKMGNQLPRAAPALFGQRGQLPPLPPWLRRPWLTLSEKNLNPFVPFLFSLAVFLG
jgi:hypothetical protein